MAIERIVITFQQDGKFRGASAQDYDGLPAPIDAAALEAIASTINAASLARVTELEAELVTAKTTLEADRDLARSKLTEIAIVAESATADNINAVKVEIVAKADEGKGSALQKEIDALQAKIAADQLRLAELQAKLP